MTAYRVRFEGPAALVVSVATALADADGVELISSEHPSNRGANMVRLEVAVEGAGEDVATAVAGLRDGLPNGASLEIVAD